MTTPPSKRGALIVSGTAPKRPHKLPQAAIHMYAGLVFYVRRLWLEGRINSDIDIFILTPWHGLESAREKSEPVTANEIYSITGYSEHLKNHMRWQFEDLAKNYTHACVAVYKTDLALLRELGLERIANVTVVGGHVGGKVKGIINWIEDYTKADTA